MSKLNIPESLDSFFMDYLPIEIYKKVILGEVETLGEEVATALNKLFLSLYLPALYYINEGEYAPTYDAEQEFSHRLYDLLCFGVVTEQFFNDVLRVEE